MEALSLERDALWSRLERTSFLSDAEKRAAVGCGDKPEGADGANRPFARKYREDQARDDQGQWVDEGGGSGEGSGDNEGGRVFTLVYEEPGVGDNADNGNGRGHSVDNEPLREPDEFDNEGEQEHLLHQVSRRGPGQSGNPRLDATFREARQAVRQARELDPNWQPPRSFVSRDDINGQIAHYEAVARAAKERYGELTRDAVPGVNPSWGVNRLRDELLDRGFFFEKTTRAPGWLYSNPQTGEQVRIMEQPSFRYRSDPAEKFFFSYYYRYRSGSGAAEGRHIPVPNK